MDDYNKLLRTGELAKLFHVSAKAVTRYAQNDGLPHLVTPGGHRRYPKGPALEWLDEQLERAKDRNKRAAEVMHAGRVDP